MMPANRKPTGAPFVVVLVALALLACTGGGKPADPEAAPTATAPMATASPPPIVATAALAPRQRWQVGEPIALAVTSYDGATLSEVTAKTVLPPRNALDRDGGAFAWQRATDRLLFIDGIRNLFLAPGSVDERPIGIAFTPLYDLDVLRSVIVRLDPLEAVALPLIVNVQGAPFDPRWDGDTTVSVSINQVVTVDGRTVPEGSYTLNLETATLMLVEERRRVPSSVIQVEGTWRAGQFGDVSMLVVNGRRSLNRGDGGLGAELAGPVDRWELSPDGARLLMIANRSQLIVYEIEADRLWVLGRPAEYGSVLWSPGARYIAATVFDAFEDTTQAFVFDVENLEAVSQPDFGASAADGLPFPPLDGSWAWWWRGTSELIVGSKGALSLLEIETGEMHTILDDRQPYDTLAWHEATSTLARSRLSGVPVSILELDGAAVWFDISLLAASPHVRLFDMNWGAEGQWLALNTAPGRS